MAFTTEEEEKVRAIISAFENGKTINDLPSAGDKNPFDLICEVMSSDGESMKANLASMLPYLEEQVMYGAEFDLSVQNCPVTRIGNLDLHRTLPIHKRIRGCLLNDNGDVNEYMNAKDWRGHTRDGSKGQSMDEIPTCYFRLESEGTILRPKFSEYPLPGYMRIEQFYYGTYEASLQRSTLKLASVVNSDPDYRGGANQSDWDGTYRSLLGRPVTQISLTDCRNYARKRKPSTKEWNCNVEFYRNILYWLFVVEYATLDTQAPFNPELTAEGFHQGGLGPGVTTLDGSKWNNFNGYHPFIPCGYTDEFGNESGVKEFTMPTEYDTNIKTVQVPRYRGIENPFGHIWEWTDGVLVRIQSEAAGGRSKVYTTKNPEYFNDSNTDNMEYVGDEARTNGFVTDIIGGEKGVIIPSKVGGSDTTYFRDYHYTNIPSSGEAIRGVLFGGHAHSGSPAGFVSADSANAPSSTSAYIGSRLYFIPE